MPDLTIIDLPGIVRTEVDGQEKGVVARVKSMLMHYLEQKRTIILAVVPSNADIATSEILQMAQEVDPDGERTVGVLTKPDLVDKGAEDEVMEVLMNQRKEPKHGYYMLKNRSQEALKGNMSLEEVHKEEMLYFQTSRYAGAQSRLGVDALSTA